MTSGFDGSRALLLSPGEARDVAVVCEIGQSSIQGHVAPGVLHARMNRQPDVLTCVRAVSGGPIVGYSITYWLTRRAIDKILSGEVRSGHDLLLEDLALPSRPAAACYLGMIWRVSEPRGPRGTSQVTALLLTHLQRQCRIRAVTTLVARPASPAGARLMTSLGMCLIGPVSGSLWIGDVHNVPGNG